jgi:hypothetical protein
VLVKRIEMNQGPEPVVILEQYGTEVNKVVGKYLLMHKQVNQQVLPQVTHSQVTRVPRMIDKRCRQRKTIG